MNNPKIGWFASILLGASLALPPVLFAAQKGDMMKDDKGMMMKEDKDAKMKKETKMMQDDKKMESKEKKMK